MTGTIDLTKGILQGFKEKGYEIGGFDAYITSNVISAAGVSSSAAYEMLICSMLNTFFNGGKMDVVTYSHIGKYSENHFWNKASRGCWTRWPAQSEALLPSILRIRKNRL